MEAKPDKPEGKEWDGTSIVLCFIFILFAILFVVLGLFVYERFVLILFSALIGCKIMGGMQKPCSLSFFNIMIILTFTSS